MRYSLNTQKRREREMANVQANNEYFTVESIANTTFMVVDRLPINSFSAVNAYRLN